MEIDTWKRESFKKFKQSVTGEIFFDALMILAENERDKIDNLFKNGRLHSDPDYIKYTQVKYKVLTDIINMDFDTIKQIHEEKIENESERNKIRRSS